jgi:hypothetical protein
MLKEGKAKKVRTCYSFCHPLKVLSGPILKSVEGKLKTADIYIGR